MHFMWKLIIAMAKIDLLTDIASVSQLVGLCMCQQFNLARPVI